MSETFAFENLIGGSQKPIVQRPGVARLFESFSRGQIIGRLTATGKWQIIDITGIATCNDFGIAVEAVDASLEEVNTSIYVEGEFNENHVLYSYSDTADDWRETLASHGIYLRKAVTTAGV
jgi:hypothetical protein